MLPDTQEKTNTVPQHLSGTRAGVFYLLRQSAEGSSASETARPSPHPARTPYPARNVEPFPLRRDAPSSKATEVRNAFLEDTFVFDL